MSNNNHIRGLIIILCSSFQEILCNPHSFHHEFPSSRRMQVSGQCASETAALGDLGNPAALFPDLGALLANCAVGIGAVLTGICNFPDTMSECLALGGQHRILNFENACSNAIINSTNFPICAGASCDINSFVDVAKVDVEQALQALLLSPLIPVVIDLNTCSSYLNLTETISPTPQPTAMPVTTPTTPQPTAVTVSPTLQPAEVITTSPKPQTTPVTTTPSTRQPVTVTEQCASETTALGDIGNSVALFSNLTNLITYCSIGIGDVLTGACDLPDTSSECLAAEGQHHILSLEFACSNIVITSSNFPICAGASCNVDNFIAITRRDVDEQMRELLSDPLIPIEIDPNSCDLGLNLTASTPATGTRSPTTSESNTIRSTYSIYFLFMVAVPLLVAV